MLHTIKFLLKPLKTEYLMILLGMKTIVMILTLSWLLFIANPVAAATQQQQQLLQQQPQTLNYKQQLQYQMQQHDKFQYQQHIKQQQQYYQQQQQQQQQHHHLQQPSALGEQQQHQHQQRTQQQYLAVKPTQIPTTSEEWTKVAEGFGQRWNFPNCCGALDGKHITIQAPANCGSEYFNYKKYNSIVLMAMVDAEYKFLFVEVGAFGRESDGGVFTRCPLSKALADNTINFPPPRPFPHEIDPMPIVIVADDAFPLKPYLMKPFSYREQVMSHKIFNYRLSRARNVVENVFGICASRFRILRRPMDVTAEHAKGIVLAICVLHNFLLTRKSSYLRKSDVDDDRNGIGVRGNWRMELGENGMLTSIRLDSAPGRPADNAIKVREMFMEYFMTPHGEVAWQYNRTILHKSF